MKKIDQCSFSIYLITSIAILTFDFFFFLAASHSCMENNRRHSNTNFKQFAMFLSTAHAHNLKHNEDKETKSKN